MCFNGFIHQYSKDLLMLAEIQRYLDPEKDEHNRDKGNGLLWPGLYSYT